MQHIQAPRDRQQRERRELKSQVTALVAQANWTVDPAYVLSPGLFAYLVGKVARDEQLQLKRRIDAKQSAGQFAGVTASASGPLAQKDQVEADSQ